MSITVRPSSCPDQELDLTRALTAAVAHELWKQFGGNEIVNWLEAERIVSTLTPRASRRAAVVGWRHAAEREVSTRRRRRDPEPAAGPIPYL